MKNDRKLKFESLEKREMLSTSHYIDDSTLYIDGDSQNDKVFVYEHWLYTNNKWKYIDLSKVTNIEFHGGRGNDVFVNNTNVASVIFGDEGNDWLYGGFADDLIYGGDGRDRLHGRKGNDVLFGGNAKDHLFGRFGVNEIDGGEGRDVIYASGNDTLLDSNEDYKLFNLYHYGILPNGTDQTLQIQTALDDIGQYDGYVKVNFPRGNFIVSSLNIPANISHLTGYNTTLTMLAGSDKWTRIFNVKDNDGIKIYGFKADLNRDAHNWLGGFNLEHQAFIFISNSNVTVLNVKIYNGAGDGISVYNNSTFYFNNIYTEKVFRGGITISGQNITGQITNYTVVESGLRL